MKFPVTVNGRELIDSNNILLTANDEVTINIEGMTLRFVFENDSNVQGSNYRGSGEGNTFTMHLVNFRNNLGEGVLNPLEIGQRNGQRLFVSFFVHTLPNQDRRLEYNLFVEGGANGG
ncbi:DUF6864 domain-containing function [Vibrio alginolyticus]|uniref:DUF6864 domain-containing function n=1 Tax=Vibrio alginolyticus TaxID=663 RepID=UPI001BD4C3DE|nr:hypothetical protein [Vibrio alginolyticus]MBT0091379.1 hypothetical protein [Vibrio alginolyticus]MCR9513219.1 hypothetical protein [Vibrio alginolyticus]